MASIKEIKEKFFQPRIDNFYTHQNLYDETDLVTWQEIGPFTSKKVTEWSFSFGNGGEYAVYHEIREGNQLRREELVAFELEEGGLKPTFNILQVDGQKVGEVAKKDLETMKKMLSSRGEEFIKLGVNRDSVVLVINKLTGLIDGERESDGRFHIPTMEEVYGVKDSK